VNREPAVSPDSPIELFLDDLVTASGAMAPRDLRRLLTESEAHLRDDADAGIQRGIAQYDAEAGSVARFGAAHAIAAADRDRSIAPISRILKQVLFGAVQLASIGAIAVGVSGVIAWIIRVIGGARAVIDVAPDRVLSPSDCARWLANTPGAASCRTAAIDDWAAETVFYRLGLGLMGLIALVALKFVTARRPNIIRESRLMQVVTDTVAVTAFGAAGIGTLAFGLSAVATQSGHGFGQWLSAAPVALALAVIFGLRLVSDLRTAKVS
jgi:hypothetical protein